MTSGPPMQPVSVAEPPSQQESRWGRVLEEASGLLRGPQRIPQLMFRLAQDELRMLFKESQLYSYAHATRSSAEMLRAIVEWILKAQRSDGGIAAYYSLLTGYSESYPEVTGYIVPTLYDYAREAGDENARKAAESATRWLLTLQMASGAFPGGLHGVEPQASVFNTGQILQGLVRAHAETGNADVLKGALRAGDWLASAQGSDGSWSGPGAYQGVAHTYYSMVAWALALLARDSGEERYGLAADRNIDWVLPHFQRNGWIDGINLQGHPAYLHFVAYAIQGTLECGILRQRNDAIFAAAESAWVLLRKFETHKHLCGAYGPDFKGGLGFSCLTGNAQMSCVWLRLYEVTRDLRFLNAALKMNEMVEQHVPLRGRGVAGGVAGSHPHWGAYQALRYLSWGCKFFADALLLQQRFLREFEASACA
ncbi:MAG TPA: prenyltransferase/squalene oxidase repeat-containing protein [Terriglobales bacterium]|nr:prenyltransferase/squalene oxidase repeat-containing protein [Terriglobales bacterium]